MKKIFFILIVVFGTVQSQSGICHTDWGCLTDINCPGGTCVSHAVTCEFNNVKFIGAYENRCVCGSSSTVTLIPAGISSRATCSRTKTCATGACVEMTPRCEYKSDQLKNAQPVKQSYCTIS